jgi:hypothetical protein
METQAIYQLQKDDPHQFSGVRRFVLIRERDLTGVSGVGVVAEGAVFSNGLSILRWLREPHAVGMYQSVSDLIAVHGHGGATQVQFIDQA